MDIAINTKPTGTTLSKAQATTLNQQLARTRPPVRYLEKFDTDRIYRRGRIDDSTISKPKIHEDERPLQMKDRVTGRIREKRNDVITYVENDTLYVLAKSGGVSLFDGMSPKQTLGPKDRWYCCFVSRDTPIPEGLLLAKDAKMDAYGHFHYAFEAAYDMPLSEFRKKLKQLDKYMRVV